MPPLDLSEHLLRALPLLRLPRLGLFVDFDGTISEMAPTPDQAVISPACAEALDRLSQQLALVVVVSGRAAEDLRDKVGLENVVYVGNHGAEYLTADGLTVAPGAEGYPEKIGSLLGHLRAAVDYPGLVWQAKGPSASVHYRLAAEHDEAVRRLTSALDAAPGVDEVEVFWGKMVLELRPPGGLDKGSAVRRLVHDLRLLGAIVIGDDVTDVDALRALRELRDEGSLDAVTVAVVYPDTPRALLEVADYGVGGVSGVASLLGWLATATADKGPSAG